MHSSALFSCRFIAALLRFLIRMVHAMYYLWHRPQAAGCALQSRGCEWPLWVEVAIGEYHANVLVCFEIENQLSKACLAKTRPPSGGV